MQVLKVEKGTKICTYLQPTENTSKQACFVRAKSWISIVPESGND